MKPAAASDPKRETTATMIETTGEEGKSVFSFLVEDSEFSELDSKKGNFCFGKKRSHCFLLVYLPSTIFADFVGAKGETEKMDQDCRLACYVRLFSDRSLKTNVRT